MVYSLASAAGSKPNSRSVAEAVARASFPILTGLGHEIDQSITDRVAHTSLKTPTKVAEYLVELLATAEAEILELHRRLAREAQEPLRRADEAIDRAEQGLKLARARLTAAAAKLQESARLLAHFSEARLRRARESCRALGLGLGRSAPRLLQHRQQRPREIQLRIIAHARGRLAQAEATIEGMARLANQLSPERTLGRGFSITRTADGALLRDSAGAAPGTTIHTQLGSGTLKSRVED